jgi:lipopolysaccharide transport system ATP-binding protein
MANVIQVDGLGKRYWIRHDARARYRSLREELTEWVTSRVRALAPGAKNGAGAAAREEFWALKDVSFGVEPGEVVGIIGRNGAGKSTLLKILSRITEPTEGRVEIDGRVASLLEVGTGFHPELTGRENIFLNGAIMGMTRAEIRKKFDEIVAFAEVERFLDTPVKRYSSGMYVRLAFAVAAHLEPEILVVDEVLAVGDAQFQKKCIGKMEDVSKQEGRTVLFVSHNTGVIAQLCSKAILLDKGRVLMVDRTETVVDAYLNRHDESSSAIQKAGAPGENQFTLAHMSDREGGTRVEYRFDEEILVAVELSVESFSEDLELAMRLMDRQKNAVFTIHEKLDKHRRPGSATIRLNVVIPAVFVAPGKYSWLMCINKPGVQAFDLQNDVLQFHVVDTGSEFSRYQGANYGSVFAQYSIESVAS